MASESASDHAPSRIANMTPGDGAASELDSPGRQQRRAASLEAELRNKLKRSKWNAAEDPNEEQQDNEEDRQQGPTKIRRRMLKVRVRERDAEEEGSDPMRQQQQQHPQQRSPRSVHSHARSLEPHPSSPNRETASYAVEAHQERPKNSTPPSILPKRWPRSHLAPPRSSHPPLTPCRSVYNYTRLNHIEEGTYGIVFRAKCNSTGNIYALKKLKLEEERQGFPITSLREVMALMVAGGHENVVGVREIVVGDTLNQ